jgi:hypothetical protein
MPENAGTIYSEVRVALDKLTGDIKSVQTSFDQLAQTNKKQTQEFKKSWEDSFKSISAEMQKIGKNLSLSVTAPLMAMAALSVKEWNKQVEAIDRLDNAIKQTGKTAVISSKDIQDLASKLQLVTTYGDDVTVSAAATLQGLADLDQKGLMELIPHVQDLAAFYKMDLVSAAELVGKTLGTNTNALGRYGVEIDGNADKSTKLVQVIDQLNKKFGGTAEAVGKTQQLTIFKNQLGDLAESIGKVLVPAMNEILKNITPFVTGFANMDESTKKMIIGMAGVAAAAGPTILALKSIGTAVTSTTGMVGLAFAAIAGLVAMFQGLAAQAARAKDEQKLVDEAMKGAASTTAEYDQALKILAERQRYEGATIEEMAAKQGVSFKKINDGWATYYVTVDKTGKEIAITTEKEFESLKQRLKLNQDQINTIKKYRDAQKKAEQDELDAATAKLKLNEKIEAEGKKADVDWVDRHNKKRSLDADFYQELTTNTEEYVKDRIKANEEIERSDAEMAAEWWRRFREMKDAEEKGRKDKVSAEEEANKQIMNSATGIAGAIADLAGSTSENIGQNLIAMVGEVAAATNTAEGKIIAGVIDLFPKIAEFVDWLNNQFHYSEEQFADMTSSILTQLLDQQISNIQDTLDQQIEAIDEALEAELRAAGLIEEENRRAHDEKTRQWADEDYHAKKKYDAEIKRLDAEMEAKLKAAGLAEKTEAEQLNEKLAAINKELAAATDAEERARLVAEQQELLKQIARQAIVDEYDAKKLKVEEDEEARRVALEEKRHLEDEAERARDEERFQIQQEYQRQRDEAEEEANKQLRQYEHDKAILERDVALAEILIEWQKAIAELGWFNADKKTQVRTLYEALYAAVLAIPIPELDTGGIVIPQAGGGGTLARVAVNTPEAYITAGAEGEAFLYTLADKIAERIGSAGGGGTFVFPLVFDGRQVAELTVKYFNKGIVKLEKKG